MIMRKLEGLQARIEAELGASLGLLKEAGHIECWGYVFVSPRHPGFNGDTGVRLSIFQDTGTDRIRSNCLFGVDESFTTNDFAARLIDSVVAILDLRQENQMRRDGVDPDANVGSAGEKLDKWLADHGEEFRVLEDEVTELIKRGLEG